VADLLRLEDPEILRSFLSPSDTRPRPPGASLRHTIEATWRDTMTTQSAQHIDIVTHGFTTDFDRHAHHYETEFRNETDHRLMLVAACHGGRDEWDVAPPSTVEAGETARFTIASAARAAGGVVIYRDVVRGGIVTFCGNAASRPGASCAFATPSDGLIAVGPQGYLPGTHSSVHAEYVLG
jgi:hypothetical protein